MSAKSVAKRRIGSSLSEITLLEGLSSGSPEFIKWIRTTERAIYATFGESSRELRDFHGIRFVSGLAGANVAYEREVYSQSLVEARAILESMLDGIEEYSEDDNAPLPASSMQEMPEQQVSNRVFVVHGRDDGTRNTVARFLKSLELEPIILQEQPNEGRTVIQKFEDHAGVSFAVVLCTPDDAGALSSEKDKLSPRPRQNVILELGFFWGRLGRKKVCALLDGDMDMPSDYGGVLYIPLDDAEGWKLTLAREMRAAGMSIDMNLIA